MREQGAMSDALLLGRQTFEDFRGYWPLQTAGPSGTADYLNRVTKYVVSSTLGDPEWENTIVLRVDPVDEYRLFVYPFVAGEGHRRHRPRRSEAGVILDPEPFERAARHTETEP